ERSGPRSRYQSLANWTARCPGSREELPTRRVSTSQCSEESFEGCAGIADHGQAVPRECRVLRPAPGSGVRLRRKLLISDTKAFGWMQEGERLFREFVQRHGLFLAVWTTVRQELAPSISGKPRARQDGVWPTTEELLDRDTMFSVLQSIQDLLSSAEADA
ncbi:unnamed protein product, partial [Polarella glacialis]